ncbi:hypothetical protein S83_035182, partial [Arachis hypogaea]
WSEKCNTYERLLVFLCEFQRTSLIVCGDQLYRMDYLELVQVDLDPYSSPSMFLDSVVQYVADGAQRKILNCTKRFDNSNTERLMESMSEEERKGNLDLM